MRRIRAEPGLQILCTLIFLFHILIPLEQTTGQDSYDWGHTLSQVSLFRTGVRRISTRDHGDITWFPSIVSPLLKSPKAIPLGLSSAGETASADYYWNSRFASKNEQGFGGLLWSSCGSTGYLFWGWAGYSNQREELALTIHPPKIGQTSVVSQNSNWQLSQSCFLHSIQVTVSILIKTINTEKARNIERCLTGWNPVSIAKRFASLSIVSLFLWALPWLQWLLFPRSTSAMLFQRTLLGLLELICPPALRLGPGWSLGREWLGQQ